jgi:hypothetical protein
MSSRNCARRDEVSTVAMSSKVRNGREKQNERVHAAFGRDKREANILYLGRRGIYQSGSRRMGDN